MRASAFFAVLDKVKETKQVKETNESSKHFRATVFPTKSIFIDSMVSISFRIFQSGMQLDGGVRKID